MKHAHALLLVLMALAFAGCGDRGPKRAPGQPRAVSPTVAAEADSYASDASFALQIHDFNRAAESLKKAVKVRDDLPDRWEALAYAYKQLGQTSDAKDAYRTALKLWKQYYGETKSPEMGLHEVYILVFLGRGDDARDLVQKLAKDHPDDPEIQTFYKNKGVDAMLADPGVKDRSI